MRRRQSRMVSAIEALANVFIGYWLAVAVQFVIFPWYGYDPTWEAVTSMGAVFTIVSVLRSYFLRRVFEWFR